MQHNYFLGDIYYFYGSVQNSSKCTNILTGHIPLSPSSSWIVPWPRSAKKQSLLALALALVLALLFAIDIVFCPDNASYCVCAAVVVPNSDQRRTKINLQIIKEMKKHVKLLHGIKNRTKKRTLKCRLGRKAWGSGGKSVPPWYLNRDQIK